METFCSYCHIILALSYISSLFHFIAKQYDILWIYSICLPAHDSYFQFGVLMDKIAKKSEHRSMWT
jgi:predicted RNA-binding protein associated with RNAse of E/G family